MSTSASSTDTHHGHPLVKVVLSLAVLGIALYITDQQRKPKTLRFVEPASPASRRNVTPAAGGPFAWIPTYPGARIGDIRRDATANALKYGFDFQTLDRIDDVAAFFDHGLRQSGLSVITAKPTSEVRTMHGEGRDGRFVIDIGVDKTPSGSEVIVTATEQLLGDRNLQPKHILRIFGHHHRRRCRPAR
jgi:hypothetical protein